MNYGKLTAGTTKTAIDTAKPSEKGEIITYLSRMGDVLDEVLERDNQFIRGLLAAEAVIMIVDGDETDAKKREYLFDIFSGVQIIAAKP